MRLRFQHQQTMKQKVSSTDSGSQGTANRQSKAVATDSDGDFVAVWASDHAGSLDICAQRFNSLGLSQGLETRINTTTSGI